ncbi:uncharacterized protein YciI [Pullulanibacillus pueri]|uniref:YCII-related domain-containing protein n=1 Tax=Pullulanibacillus pueri TaxID=1437324 RepID=A0A8J2ZRI2_9BACL|nr:YciI family protein [Pullulanibacillus pueri]MBM7679901.1 uncharacterized protein YciI [Pullulanibacillus pueri]GGH73399.1 hypothetical protein GCM10007096_00590 [Pullulanibacillus pueri]
MRFLILFTPTDKWKKDIFFNDQPFMPEHVVYVQQAFDQGHVLLAGPFMDFSGGAIVIDFDTEEAAKAFVKKDPIVQNGVFSYQMKEWNVGMSKLENKNPQVGLDFIERKRKKQKKLGII